MKKSEKGLGLYILLFVSMLLLFLFVTGGSVHKLILQADQEQEQQPVIIIDAGHGGEDGGTQGNGLLEKDVNLSIALSLQDLLRARGFQVIMVRTTDSDVADHSLKTVSERKKSDLKKRVALVEEQDNCILISIHQNYFEQQQYCGTQVFYSTQNTGSTELAQCIQDTVRNSLQADNDRETKPGEGIYLLEQVDVPAVLVECGFLSNPDEAAALSEPLYQKQMALCIFSGICDYISSAYSSKQSVWFEVEELPE